MALENLRILDLLLEHVDFPADGFLRWRAARSEASQTTGPGLKTLKKVSDHAVTPFGFLPAHLKLHILIDF